LADWIDESKGDFTTVTRSFSSLRLFRTNEGCCLAARWAHLGVARANALQARTSQGADADAARVHALAAYKDFLTSGKTPTPTSPS